MATSFELRLADINRLNELSVKDSALNEAEEPAQFTAPFLQKIGISYKPKLFGDGYIKYSYRDFIVEEISEKNELIDISPEQSVANQDFSNNENGRLKLETDMVKQGFSTFEAIERLAEELKLKLNQITYGGLKDSKAITAQRISINNTAIDQLLSLKLPNIFFKNNRYRVGMRNTGELSGNRFTILVRTSTEKSEELSRKLEEIGDNGFLNFFSLQRFGGRLLSHEIGKQILLSRHEDAIRLLIAGISPHESKILQNIRNQIISEWGNWNRVAELLGQFPYFFQHEIKVVNSLRSKPGDIIAALQAIPDQAKMAKAAYSSYCFNKALSKQVIAGQVDDKIPLLSQESAGWYNKILPEENIEQLRWKQPGFGFFGPSRLRQVPTRAKVQVHSVTPCKAGLIFHFDLPKGSYATTFLSELFNLYQGRPVPEWVNEEQVDSREIIGYLPTDTTEQKFPGSEQSPS